MVMRRLLRCAHHRAAGACDSEQLRTVLQSHAGACEDAKEEAQCAIARSSECGDKIAIALTISFLHALAYVLFV